MSFYVRLSGYYCLPELVTVGDVNTVITLCPEGYYCPNGTGYDWQSCPAGTYSSVRGLATALECTPCDAGYYCSGAFVTSCDNVYSVDILHTLV